MKEQDSNETLKRIQGRKRGTRAGAGASGQGLPGVAEFERRWNLARILV
jgi:hypothetical protein